jgi:hypothetical protein
MRSVVLTVLCASALVGAFGACESFDDAPTVTPDAGDPNDAMAANDAPDARATTSDGGDSSVAPFCDSHRDAAEVCFDFDTEPLAPKWTTFTFGDASVAVVEDGAASPPRAALMTIHQPGSDAGASVATIARTVQGDLANAAIDFDVAVDEVTTLTTVVYVNLYDGTNNLLCGLGLNADLQSSAMLVASVVGAPIGFGTKSRVDTFPIATFGHVAFRWRASPPQISAVIDGHELGSLDAPDCVAAKRAEIAFGVQTPRSPVTARARIDNVVYSFTP